MNRDSVLCFENLLKKQGLRYTHERKCILGRVARLKEHFSADSLAAFVKINYPRISRATVYRTLSLLLESGVIQKSIGKGNCEFYESNCRPKHHHDHLYCISCHKIIEFASDEIERFQKKICEQHHFRILFHDHRLYGYCPDCKRK